MKVTSHENVGYGDVEYTSITLGKDTPETSLVTMSALVDEDSSCSLSVNFLTIDDDLKRVTSSFTINDYIVAPSLSEAVYNFIMSYQKCHTFRSLKVSDSLYVSDVNGNERPCVSVHSIMIDYTGGYNRITPEFLFSSNESEPKVYSPRLRK